MEESQDTKHEGDVIYLEGLDSVEEKINPDNDRFPFCIVWTAIPLLTWLIPVIGHTGIGM